MNRFFLLATALFLAAGFFAGTAAAQKKAEAPAYSESLTADDKAYFAAVRTAILKDEGEWLAGEIFPALTVVINGQSVTITSKKQFLDRYDEFITPALRAAVEDLKPSSLAKDWKGVTAGGGVLAFGQMAIVDEKTGKEGPMRYYITGIGAAPAATIDGKQ